MNEEEQLIKRVPSVCKECEHKEYNKTEHRYWCLFWFIPLTEVEWCNK